MVRQYILDNQPELLRAALKAQPNIAGKIDEDGRTPLFWAISQNNQEMVNLCLEYPQDTALADNAGWTILHTASAIGNLLIFNSIMALSTPPPIDAKTNAGQTAVQLAVSKQHFGIVDELIRLGANIKSKDKIGKTALQRAASLGSVKMVEILLDAGAPINATDSNGWTALHDAVAEGNTDVVSILIKRGANVDAENNQDRKPIHVAPNLQYATEISELIKQLSE